MSNQVHSTFQLSGMHCAACQKVAQKKLGTILDAQVSKLEINGELELTAPRPISLTEVATALTGTNYSVTAILQKGNL